MFHAEADAGLVEHWIDVPEMVEEARAALGPDAEETLRTQAAEHEADLIARSTPGFQAFAELVAGRLDDPRWT